MRVFVTGASGFVGSHAVPLLLDRGHRVAVLLRTSSAHERVDERATRIMGDLTESEGFDTALRAFAPEAVVHLAWSGVAGRHRDDVAQIDNLDISRRLMERAAAVGVRHWLALGSQAEYGPHGHAIDELTTPTLPTTAYGAVKLATCHVTRVQAGHLGLRFAWLRLFSCYGPKDYGDWLIPYLITTLLRGKTPKMTLGEQRWDYLHVGDVASALAATLESTEASGVFNLGSGACITIRSIAERLRDLIDPGLDIALGANPYRTDQVMHLQAKIDQLRAATGWCPTVPLERGLAETVEWFRANRV